MAEYLVFTLAASLSSHGEFGGHERRGSLSWPGRSAILGLLGAAMGIKRDDAHGWAALDGLQMAVAVYDEGQPLRDYHTIETVPNAAVKRPDSRPQALKAAKGKTNTSITHRDYRVGGLYSVAIWGAVLQPLKDALLGPHFVLYLGRKSCPLAAPPAPQIVEAAGPLQALEQAQLPEFRKTKQSDGQMVNPRICFVASDCDLGGTIIEQRNDVPVDREAWHFTSRSVHILRMDALA